MHYTTCLPSKNRDSASLILTKPKSRITNVEATVVQKLNQGTIRHRDVIDGGALFGYFLGKQKVTNKLAFYSQTTEATI